MDLSRSSSSVYSSETPGNKYDARRASTYLDYRSSPSTTTQHARSVSSQASPSSSSRRNHTPTPSYMNYQNGAAAKAATQSPSTPHPTPTPEATPSKPSVPASASFGLLLLALAAEPHPSTVRTVERFLKARSYASIAILADIEQENTVKELKIGLYSLIGSMGLEMAVNIYLRDGWSEPNAASAVQAATNNAGALRTVLCSPVYDPAISTAEADILALPSTSFEKSWTTSFSFLHSLAKACLPPLSASSSGSSNGPSTPRSPSKPLPHLPEQAQFAILNPRIDTPPAQISKAACDALLAQVSRSYAGAVIVGSIEQLLPPERKPLASSPRQLQGNGAVTSPAAGVPELDSLMVGDGRQQHDRGYARAGYEEGSSPTELYSMWALQEQFDGHEIE